MRAAISLLYVRRAHDGGMKTVLRKPQPPPFPFRLVGAIASVAVFLLAVTQLATGAGDDAWRFVAVASFYAAFRLTLRGEQRDRHAIVPHRRRHSLR